MGRQRRRAFSARVPTGDGKADTNEQTFRLIELRSLLPFRDGKPLEWPSDEGHFLVIFVPEDRGPNDDPVLAESDRATGTYRIPEIKSGRYMVAIHQFDARHVDALQNKYDPVKTPVRVDVSDDGQVIDIDLPKELPR